jgi:hypothetical protein
LKSLTATPKGASPTAKLLAAPKLSSAPPSSTETLSEFWLATARSGSESPSKSATATKRGASPTAKLVGPLKLTAADAAGAAAAISTRSRLVIERHRSGERHVRRTGAKDAVARGGVKATQLDIGDLLRSSPAVPARVPSPNLSP